MHRGPAGRRAPAAEDSPGLGKTLVGRPWLRSVSGTFRRIQFTPDLLPADITGSSIYNSHSQEFTFAPGPVFANVVLADEINRTTPPAERCWKPWARARSVDGQSHAPGRFW